MKNDNIIYVIEHGGLILGVYSSYRKAFNVIKKHNLYEYQITYIIEWKLNSNKKEYILIEEDK